MLYKRSRSFICRQAQAIPALTAHLQSITVHRLVLIIRLAINRRLSYPEYTVGEQFAQGYL